MALIALARERREMQWREARVAITCGLANPQAVLLVQRVQQHVEPDARGVLLRVPSTADRFVAFERAADVVGRKDHGPTAIDLNAFKLRFDLANSGGNGLVAFRRGGVAE